jgi:glycosyltransferase involved in cell wall biosynthesis
MFVSVIIPTYNRRYILEHTLARLLNQTLSSEAYELIVVDDCSIDSTSTYMSSLACDDLNVTYIRHTANKGRVVTRNDGIHAARGTIVIFLDDDNVPNNTFIEAHLECYLRHRDDRIAVIGNVLYPPNIIGTSNFARFMNSRYLGNRKPSERSRLDYSNLPAKCLGTLNCSMYMNDLIAVGMLDEAFRYYGGEDEYLGYCLKKNGVRLLFCEAARTTHYDIVSLSRYKHKVYESSTHALPVMMNKCPEYIASTKLHYLIPVSSYSDSFSMVLIKRVLRMLLNDVILSTLEYWLHRIDNVSLFYCSALYRILIAGWILQSQIDGFTYDEYICY